MSHIDSYFELEVSKNKQVATIIQLETVDEEIQLTHELLGEYLQRNKISYGVDEKVIVTICNKEAPIKSRMKIATGKEPVKGKDAFILPVLVNNETTQDHQSLQNMNLKQFLEIPSVSIGDKVATKVRATKGEVGYNVYGEEIPAKQGRDFTMRKGKNTRLDEEAEALFSLIDGQISIDKFTVHVHPTYEVKGDVTLATGNISFVGNVTINGNVPTGFEVYADGDIRVSGTVEAAKLKAGGSIFIGAGIVGQNRSLVEAGGDIQTTFINEGHVIAEGSIEATQAILHSTCIAGQKIICTRGKGLLIGGSASARQSIHINEVGNDMQTETKLFIGLNQRDLERQKKLTADLKTAQEDFLKLGKLLKLLLEKEKQQGELLGREKLTKLKVQHSFQAIKQKMDELNELVKGNEVEESHDEGFILVSRTIYQNVDVHFGKYRKRILSKYTKPKIALINQEIKIMTT